MVLKTFSRFELPLRDRRQSTRLRDCHLLQINLPRAGCRGQAPHAPLGVHRVIALLKGLFVFLRTAVCGEAERISVLTSGGRASAPRLRKTETNSRSLVIKTLPRGGDC